jgi:DNA-binding response OmpR family regulator
VNETALLSQVELHDRVARLAALERGSGSPGEAAAAELIADELRACGYKTLVARDGHDALQLLGERRPDAIVLDLMMPIVHGWDFIETYQHHTRGKEIPIIVVSAAGAVPRSVERYGVRGFVPKPFDLEELLRQIAAAVGV